MRYRLAQGTDVVALSSGDTLLRSDAVAIRLEGSSSALFRDRVLPLLDGSRTLEDLGALLPDLALDDLRAHLDNLVSANILRRDGAAAGAGAESPDMAPLLSFLEALGLPAGETEQRLGLTRVGIMGLEGPGAHAASALAACGVGSLLLVDPYPCEPGNVALMPGVGEQAVGKPRQEVTKAAVEAMGRGTRIELAPGSEVTRADVERLALGCNLLVSCFDRGFSSVSHWVNGASLAQGRPAIHAQLRGSQAVVGPVVLPGQTACYMCWRMRSIACDDDYLAAMAYEEFLDQRRWPALHERGVFPPLSTYAGGMVAAEALKVMLLPSAETLVGKVQVFDVLECRTEVHAVLQAPDCPTCGKRKKVQGGPTRPWAS